MVGTASCAHFATGQGASYSSCLGRPGWEQGAGAGSYSPVSLPSGSRWDARSNSKFQLSEVVPSWSDVIGSSVLVREISSCWGGVLSMGALDWDGNGRAVPCCFYGHSGEKGDLLVERPRGVDASHVVAF